jgi:purine nucleoside permease
LAILTGEATARAAASIMALGCDRRFDLSHAYWIVTGTAGVDPKIASVGSAAWSRWVVDGDLAQELDARDMPADWSTGFVPYGRTEPYQQPPPAAETESGHLVYALNRSLVDWAYARTRDVALPDDPTLVKLRTPYSGLAARPPFVLEGEGLMSARTWYGARFNDWAEKWVDYWTGGQGQFAMSAEEDAGILQALTFLAHDKRVRLDRVLVLRAGSDYSIGPPELTAAEFLAKEAKEGFPATPEALDSLYAVASPIARALADDWATTRDHVPGGGR